MHINETVTETLYNLRFIGEFPDGYTLLVSLPIATQEINYQLKLNLSTNQLKAILLEENILIFSSLEDYARFKGLDLKRKKRRY